MKAAIWVGVFVSLCGAAIVGTSGRDVLNHIASAQPTGNQQIQGPAGTVPLGDAPGQWVPFSARTTRVFNPERVFIGTFYRASDGSTRSETGPPTGSVTSIAIKNMAEKLFYLWQPGRGWESHPMQLPWGKYIHPVPEGTFSDRPIAEQIEGVDLIAMPPQSSGLVRYLAPQLNYFAVKILEPCTTPGATGCGFWLSDIRIGEQPTELFRPPPGAQVVRRSEPGGIVGGPSPVRPK
jgi:hypothetical protein